MSSPASVPYEKLLELIEHELQLAGEGRFEELEHALATRAVHVDSLPVTPPASARTALELAGVLQQRLTIEVLRGREALLLALADVERGKRVARGYAPPRQRERLSASA
jgi:hypothetical protein